MTGTAQILVEALEQLEKSQAWLQRSYAKCQILDLTKSISNEGFDDLENLASRYGRTLDILINKVCRAIDTCELVEGGSLIDVIRRSAKRGIVADEIQMRQMKETRNTIVHEYTQEQLVGLFKKVRDYVPVLFAACDAAKKYSKQISNA